MAESNGRVWQLAFWVITTVAGVWLLTLTCGVVDNDRLRASEDIRIENKVNNQYYDIIQRLSRIETKIEGLK